MPDISPATAASEWRAHWTVVLAAAAGVSLSAISVSSLGVMMEPLEQEFGWSRTQISLGTSLVSFMAVLLATFVGLAIDRLGARFVGIVAATLMCSGVALMSAVAGELWQWWSLWLIVGLAASAMPTVWLTPISSLFQSGRGLAVAIALSGSGISTSLVPIVANQLLANYGWRGAYLGLGAIWAAVTLPLIVLFFRGSARPQPATGQAAATTEPSAPLPGLTAREGFTSPKFYKLALAAFLSMSAGVALILNLVPVLRYTGLTPASAAAVAGVIGLATITGRIAGGWLIDRMSAGTIAAMSSAGAIALPALLLIAPGSVAAATAGVAIYGLLGGAKVPAVAYLASRHFGARAFGTLYGATNTAIALGVGLGPLAANYVYDLTKSYTPVMWTAVPFLAMAALLYLSLGPYPDFARQEAAA
ncbi:MFS transporter [Novosphingobium sp. JCM 18896]|uniref:MFS transporter n=1 Tax=Novosphingobium sp. JCM 18896 TaxID=2989731 RepID=UPI002223C670|nr:MFS transporter [Novosphingobium sp. JCM 18896]MCW1431261.1 MFS transporter [Novosphingobium sp. JCM 18896]